MRILFIVVLLSGILLNVSLNYCASYALDFLAHSLLTLLSFLSCSLSVWALDSIRADSMSCTHAPKILKRMDKSSPTKSDPMAVSTKSVVSTLAEHPHAT